MIGESGASPRSSSLAESALAASGRIVFCCHGQKTTHWLFRCRLPCQKSTRIFAAAGAAGLAEGDEGLQKLVDGLAGGTGETLGELVGGELAAVIAEDGQNGFGLDGTAFGPLGLGEPFAGESTLHPEHYSVRQKKTSISLLPID
jgi:hypothetical protein